MIGKVSGIFFDKGSNFYNLQVKLNNDIARLNYVYVIIDKSRNEIDSLTKATLDLQ